jgi:hypothetical protein
MRLKNLATFGAAACALAMSASASFAGYMQPGETMGVSFVSPLPEGVFFADLEDYGRSDNQAGAVNAGVNIPLVIWSTPFSFYNTRVELVGAIPFVHTDGAANQIGFIDQGYGVLLAHDFGGGLTGGVGAIYRTPAGSTSVGKNILGETTSEIDLRQSLQYTSTGPGFFNGFTFIENAAYTTAFASNYNGPTMTFGSPVQNDEFSGDFTIEKTFDKFTIGFTGFGNVDTDNRNVALGAARNQGHVALGGLIAYDFGRFTATGIVTRDVYEANGLNGLDLAGYETRGWIRIIVPLYVAPAPATPVVARY